MKFITVYGSSDPYSHDMSPILVKTGYDYSDHDINGWVDKYTQRFAAQQYSAISIVVVDVNTETGEAAVLVNTQGKHPLIQKVIVNPSAQAIREARRSAPKAPKKLNPAFNPASAVFGEGWGAFPQNIAGQHLVADLAAQEAPAFAQVNPIPEF
jgi:hypothetical protein